SLPKIERGSPVYLALYGRRVVIWSSITRITPNICRRWLYGSRGYPRADLPDMARIRPKNPVPLILRRVLPCRPIFDGCDRACLAGRSTRDTDSRRAHRPTPKPSRQTPRLLVVSARIVGRGRS